VFSRCEGIIALTPDIHGLAVHAAGAQLLPFKYAAGELAPRDVEIKISHCGVCHSDLHLIDNDWQISKYPFIPGHEIVGVVSAVGADIKHLTPGQRVAVGWQAGSCGECEWCRQGQEQLCPQAQPTCVGRHGGYADSVRVQARFAIPVPDALPSEGAAPLMCAGITVYSPLRNFLARPSSRVGVVGIGGLGHLALQFARVFGCEVTALSSTKEKQPEALALGAHHFVNTRDTSEMKRVAASFDLILSTASADQDFQALVHSLRPKGALVLLGAPPSPVSVTGASLLGLNRAFAGSNTGSPHDLAEMLDVAARHNITATTQKFAMKDANKAVEAVKKNKVRYRAVLAN
jgi:uncharacterized zinc-type alcohol dehydrogenase-like protein